MNMKWMMTLTTASLLGIGFAGNTIYSEFVYFQETQDSHEISNSMYRSIMWHMDIYDNAEFYSVANDYFVDGKIDTREYAKLQILAKEKSGPLIYQNLSDEQLWHARLSFKKYLEAQANSNVIAATN